MRNYTSISKAAAALAIFGLLAASCGGDDDTDATPATTTVAEEAPITTATVDEDAELTTTVPDEDTATVDEDAELTTTVPDEDMATVVQSEGHDEEVEGFDDVEPVEQDVICGEGLTLMEEFVTDTDNGCRAEMCDDGRTDRGDCQLPPEDEPMTEEEVTAVEEAEPLDTEEYVPEGCTEVSLGVCEQDGVTYCHDTITGWAECPGQPSGDPCEHDANDPLVFMGSIQSQPAEVTLPAGVWLATVCLSNNDLITGQPAGFSANLLALQNGGIFYLLASAESVVSGSWAETIEAPDGLQQAQLNVTPDGGGSWVVAFRQGE